SHFDQRLQGGPGEAQRQPHTPPEAQLLRRGLVAIDAVAKAKHRKPFVECSSQQQFQILAALQKGALPPVPEMAGIPAKELFQKFLGLAVEAYASHPRVWSEIGYAGPAYPRGYYRIERGLRDPWEPPKAAPRQPGAPNGKPSSAPRRRTDAQA
ncbi:MAG TPA: gluconate 2-dehydrogenase subunit 3 family protein, partial [Limnochordia bacterium]